MRRAVQSFEHMRVGGLTIAAILALAPPFCGAQEKSGIVFDHGASRMMRSLSVGFALNASQAVAGEIQLAELAVKQASDPAAKQFARRLIDENRKIGEDLNATAAKQRLTLPDNATEQLLSQHADLLRRSGLRFDYAFVDDLVTDSREQVASFQKEAKKGKNIAMKSFAGRTLPVLRARFEAVRSLRAKLKPAGV